MGRHRRYPDAYAKRAKREGMPARSVYKLEEMDRRFGLLRPGARVLELGAAPGSWTLYVARRVGAGGRVLAVDKKPLEVSLPRHVEVRQADVFELDVEDGRFDVVLSDMAPSTTGDHGTDALRSSALAERAVQLAAAHLEPGGIVVVKVLEGRGIDDVAACIRADFEKLARLRPRSTRKASTEIFLLGLGKRAGGEGETSR